MKKKAKTSAFGNIKSIDTVYDEETLTKVYMAMQKSGIEAKQAIELVHALQNEGILFRERA